MKRETWEISELSVISTKRDFIIKTNRLAPCAGHFIVDFDNTVYDWALNLEQ